MDISPLLNETLKAEQKDHAANRQYFKFSTDMPNFSFHKIKPISPDMFMKETTQYSSNFYLPFKTKD